MKTVKSNFPPYSFYGKDSHLESLAMVSRYYPIRRRRDMNDAQLAHSASVLSDIAQVVLAGLCIPFFIGEGSLLLAFSGGILAGMLWFISISLLK